MFIDIQDVVKRRKYFKCVSKIFFEAYRECGWTDTIACFPNQCPPGDSVVKRSGVDVKETVCRNSGIRRQSEQHRLPEFN